MNAVAELVRDDRPFHDAFTRDPFVANCLRREQAERTARMRAAEARARAAEMRVRLEQAERDHDRRHGHERCHAGRAEILRRVSQLSDAKERGRLIATLPRCE